MIEKIKFYCLLFLAVIKTAGISAQPVRPDTIYVSRSPPVEAYSRNRKLFLGENNPNPFNDSIGTTISYSAIDASEAWLIVYNTAKIPIAYYRLASSHGEVEIVRRKWPRGEYTYALFIDGRMIRKRKMTLQ